MPDEPIHKGRFEPIHDAHAIEQVAFVLQIDRPLDEAGFVEAHKAAEKFKTDLPGVSDIQGFRIALGAPVPAGFIPPVPSIGKVFTRTGPDGVVQSELRVERMSLIYRTLLYTRWDAVWAQARKYLDVLIPKYVAPACISGIGLNFVDKFVWNGTASECRPSLLLRPASKFITPHVYEAEDLWHSHTGAFLRHDSQTKRLVNINVDYNDENPPEGLRRVVVVTTVLNDMLNQPGYGPLEVTPEAAVSVFDAHMQRLHVFAKMAFGNIINDEMSKRIALTE